MFASAAREAVFSKPEVIRRVNEQFIPVAARAPAVNGPSSPGLEGRWLQRIGRSSPAPQGIGVLNSDGQPLVWALTFESDDQVLAFLDRALERYEAHANGDAPFTIERFQEFPGRELPRVEAPEPVSSLPEDHVIEGVCPGDPPNRPAEALRAQVFGRALDDDGAPLGDGARQEHYTEDDFIITAEMERALIDALREADSGRAALPETIAREILTHAYLGFLDVQPFRNPLGCASDVGALEFHLTKSSDGARGRYRIEGHTQVRSDLARLGPGNTHAVAVDWTGWLEMEDGRIDRLLLFGEGQEELIYGQARHPLNGPGHRPSEVAVLPAGHPIDLACRVRFGIMAGRDE